MDEEAPQWCQLVCRKESGRMDDENKISNSRGSNSTYSCLITLLDPPTEQDSQSEFGSRSLNEPLGLDNCANRFGLRQTHSANGFPSLHCAKLSSWRTMSTHLLLWPDVLSDSATRACRLANFSKHKRQLETLPT